MNMMFNDEEIYLFMYAISKFGLITRYELTEAWERAYNDLYGSQS
jgi:hypothetical protein